jgi:hypothetical protein
MTPSRVQNLEGAKILVVSFKTATGAGAAISRNQFKIGCFADSKEGKHRVDKDTRLGGKHIPSA